MFLVCSTVTYLARRVVACNRVIAVPMVSVIDGIGVDLGGVEEASEDSEEQAVELHVCGFDGRVDVCCVCVVFVCWIKCRRMVLPRLLLLLPVSFEERNETQTKESRSFYVCL